MTCRNYEHSVQQKFFWPNVRSLGSLWPTSTDLLNHNASFICVCIYTHMYMCVCVYTGCPGRNVPGFGRMFLKLKYTDLSKNNYI